MYLLQVMIDPNAVAKATTQDNPPIYMINPGCGYGVSLDFIDMALDLFSKYSNDGSLENCEIEKLKQLYQDEIVLIPEKIRSKDCNAWLQFQLVEIIKLLEIDDEKFSSFLSAVNSSETSDSKENNITPLLEERPIQNQSLTSCCVM